MNGKQIGERNTNKRLICFEVSPTHKESIYSILVNFCWRIQHIWSERFGKQERKGKVNELERREEKRKLSEYYSHNIPGSVLRNRMIFKWVRREFVQFGKVAVIDDIKTGAHITGTPPTLCAAWWPLRSHHVHFIHLCFCI